MASTGHCTDFIPPPCVIRAVNISLKLKFKISIPSFPFRLNRFCLLFTKNNDTNESTTCRKDAQVRLGNMPRSFHYLCMQ